MTFVIPTINEVIDYVGGKKQEWPTTFVEYYSDRFWNHYQASGWRLSNGNAMKDWRACFNANWQVLKFKEDIEALAKAKSVVSVTIKSTNTGNDNSDMLSYVNKMIDNFSQGIVEKRIDVLKEVYHWLKSNNIIKLPKSTIDKVISESGNNRDLAKAKFVHAWIENQIKKRNNESCSTERR